jgi:hypothetical protein
VRHEAPWGAGAVAQARGIAGLIAELGLDRPVIGEPTTHACGQSSA